MKIKELLEGEVISGRFGKARGPEVDSGIEIPKGFDRFELDHKEGSNVARIIGIKGDQRKVLSSGHLSLMKELVKAYNNGGKTDIKMTPISVVDAFGSAAMKAIRKSGLQFVEKPSYWEDLDAEDAPKLSDISLKRLEKDLGYKIKTVDSTDLLGSDRGPMVKFKGEKPKDELLIVNRPNGSRYLADLTQANTYIRMWIRIN